MFSRYVIGVDYGTLSCRAVLVDTATGEVLTSKAKSYPHGVMTALGGHELPDGWCLQDPEDYLEVLICTIPELIREAGVEAENIIALGCDFTSCTMLPALADGTPLCKMDVYHDEPHAYVKLWKHHHAYQQAERIEQYLKTSYPELLHRYGGKVSAQWLLPKVLEMLEEAPDVYEDADLIMEAMDWVTYMLTGELTRSTCAAGFKSFWDPDHGYPEGIFRTDLDPRLTDLVSRKLRGSLTAPWEAVGTLTQEWAQKLGLNPGTYVTSGMIDAHAALPGAGVFESGQMVMILGTSSCQILLSDQEVPVQGICGSLKEGILPGYYAYEAGQTCVGDMFDWFVNETGSDHLRLTKEAEKLKPGGSGLVALDWWNGQRTPLVDEALSGVMVGMTIRTTAAEQYHALIEATAYGSRRIIELFETAGVMISEIHVCGGIASKNQLLMQIYADVLGRPLRVAAADQCSSLGAAIMAAAAAGIYPSVESSIRHMTKRGELVYYPDLENTIIYDKLYRIYLSMSDYFSESGIMHTLSDMKHT